MDSGNAGELSPGIRAMLAGFEAGMVAVLAMLAWLGFASAWYRRGFWAVPNLMAATFYGDDAVRPGFGSGTLAGLALYLIFYSALGALFGWAMHHHIHRVWLTLAGIVAGLLWYYLWWGGLWRYVQPLIPLYTHDRPMLVGHILYGMMLGRFPIYLRRLAPPPEPARAAESPAETPAPPPEAAP